MDLWKQKEENREKEKVSSASNDRHVL